MTQIGSFIAPTRRPGVLGVHSVDLFNVAVPDLKQAAEFYNAFGLDVREEGDALGLYTFGHPHRWGRFVEGPAKRLRFVSFGAFEDDMPRFRRRLAERGVVLRDPPPGFASNGLWFADPEGLLVEIAVKEKSSPDEKSRFALATAPPGVQGSFSRSKAPRVRPRRLAHVLMFTADVPRAVAFYRDVLGLRLSDRSGDLVAFMHGIHGSDHHMIAFVKSDGPGLHHLSWDVGSINDIGLGAMHMADQGFSAGWGLGRHVLGSNYFHYVRDPWGSWCEYSADIDYIPAGHDWADGDHAPEDAFYVWGPVPPADFVTNHEAAG